ncbi:ead/Ea22-like family protein [Atlantibacter hermannii]
MTAEQLAQLRERYQEQIGPKCHICGAEMTIQRAGGGSLVYGCTGRVDSDGDGYVFAEGRDFADNHYALSRVTVANNSDPDVLALLDELESTKRDSARWFKAFEKAVSVGARYEERIAELEARTVTVKLPESVIDAICLTAAEIHNLGRGVSDERAQEIINSIRCAAGINLTVEG